MAYNIVYKNSVHRDLKKIDKKEASRILNAVEKTLSRNPRDNPALTGPFSGLRKLRIGNYRVVYVILDNDVLILRIGHRKDVYK